MKSVWFVGIFIIGVGAWNCSKNSREVKIAIAGPFSGTGQAAGESMKRGASLASKEINSNGGIRGKMITLTFYDDGGQSDQAISVANQIASQNDVLAVVGHINSSCTFAASTVYNKVGIPQISPTSTSSKISKAGPWTYRMCVTDNLQGEYLAQYAFEKLKSRNVAIFYDNDDYGRGLKTVFNERYQKLGGKNVYETGYDKETSDFRPQLAIARKKNPDLLFLSGYYQQAASIVKTLRNQNWGVMVLGGDGLYADALIHDGGAAVEGLMLTLLFSSVAPDERTQNFLRAFETEYQITPDARAAFSYDAVRLAALAIDQAGFNRNKINGYLEQVGRENPPFEGVTGKTIFNEDGDCVKPISIGEVKNGKILPATIQF